MNKTFGVNAYLILGVVVALAFAMVGVLNYSKEKSEVSLQKKIDELSLEVERLIEENKRIQFNKNKHDDESLMESMLGYKEKSEKAENALIKLRIEQDELLKKVTSLEAELESMNEKNKVALDSDIAEIKEDGILLAVSETKDTDTQLSEKDIRLQMKELSKQLYKSKEYKEKEKKERIDRINRDWEGFYPDLDKVTKLEFLDYLANFALKKRETMSGMWYGSKEEREKIIKEIKEMESELPEKLENQFGYDVANEFEKYSKTVFIRRAIENLSFVQDNTIAKNLITERVMETSDIFNDRRVIKHYNSKDKKKLVQDKVANFKLVKKSIDSLNSDLSEAQLKELENAMNREINSYRSNY